MAFLYSPISILVVDRRLRGVITVSQTPTPKTPHRDVFSARGAYKASGRGGSRRVLVIDSGVILEQRNNGRGNLGYLESLILYYAARVAHVFRLCEVKAYYKSRGVVLEYKRLHDSAVRLCRRGLLERVERGVYRLRAEYTSVDLRVKFNSEALSGISRGGSRIVGWGVPRVLGVCGFVGGVGCLRVHVVCSCRVERLVGLFLAYWALRRDLELEASSLLRLGLVSRRELSELRRWTRRVVYSAETVYGWHSRFTGEDKPLVEMELYEPRAWGREIGRDFILGEKPTPKIHVSIYTTSSPYATVPLTAWSSERAS